MNEKPILVVEDNPADRELLVLALQKNEIKNPIVIAEDGAEALSYLCPRIDGGRAGGKETPALILLDLKLPKVSGLEVLQQIRSRKDCKLVPVVIFTSSTEDKDIDSSYALGANSYVRKPVTFEDFMALIKQLGIYWLDVNIPPNPRQVN